MKESFVTVSARLFKSRCDMNKVVGAGKDRRRLTELWSGARRRRWDLKMMVWVSRFLRWAAPRITARRGRLSRQEMNYAGEEENFAFPFFPPQSPRTVSDAFKLACSDVLPPHCHPVPVLWSYSQSNLYLRHSKSAACWTCDRRKLPLRLTWSSFRNTSVQ